MVKSPPALTPTITTISYVRIKIAPPTNTMMRTRRHSSSGCGLTRISIIILSLIPFQSDNAVFALVPFLPGFSSAGKNNKVIGEEGISAPDIIFRNSIDERMREPQEVESRSGLLLTRRREFLLSIPLSLTVCLPVPNSASAATSTGDNNDAIIVGSGLAGLVSALTILDRGGRVVILEKEDQLGGNSKKASSGINGLSKYAPPGDSVSLFEQDTYQSHHEPSSEARQLIDTLVEKSESALQWLESRLQVDITQVAQLGGHSHPRTHRPKRGMIGATLMVALFEQIRKYQEKGTAKVLTGSKAESLMTKSGSVVGVRYQQKDSNRLRHPTVYAAQTILAMGGFAASKKLLREYNPQLAHLPTTSGPWATGDGILLATAIGATMADMSKIQIHPTGFVDSKNPTSQSKVLAAEVLRGLGGILLNQQGKRFCNELGTRKYISDTMLAMPDNDHYYLVLSSPARLAASKHVDWYEAKGLMKTFQGIDSLAEWMHVSKDTLEDTFHRYEKASKNKQDEFNKSVFINVADTTNLEKETFCAGCVTPVIHYCMGGLAMNAQGQVLNASKQPIPGLFGAGEVTGGLHGDNRLGGNSLLECTVFGRIIGEETPIISNNVVADAPGDDVVVNSQKAGETNAGTRRDVTVSELEKHNSAKDCWVAIDGRVFDLTEFANIHPGGAEMIKKFAGKDASQVYDAVHAPDILNSHLAKQYQVGILAQ